MDAVTSPNANSNFAPATQRPVGLAGRFHGTTAREGDFVETSEGLFFDVKGLLHPPDRIVAYLRYYPDKRGSRYHNDRRYVKVYELSRRNQLVESKWPQYRYHDGVQGRELQGVPVNQVLNLHKPERRLKAILRSRRRDSLETNAVRLVEILAHKSRLPLANFGISGSLLVSLHSQSSDIDVIAYGMETTKQIHRALTTLLEQHERFQRYHERDLKRLYARRSMQNAIGFRDFVAHESRKVFQGKFMDHDFFIRCVKSWNEITEIYGEKRYRPLGRCMISGRVLDDTESLVTPCKYLLEQVRVLSGVSSRRPREVASFRGRFTEQARGGEKIVARGSLESVRSGDLSYFRLVVGEGQADVLRTIR